MSNGGVDRDWIKWVLGLAITVLSGVLYKAIAKMDTLDSRVVALEVKTHGMEVQMDSVGESVTKSATKIDLIVEQLTDIKIALGVRTSHP